MSPKVLENRSQQLERATSFQKTRAQTEAMGHGIGAWRHLWASWRHFGVRCTNKTKVARISELLNKNNSDSDKRTFQTHSMEMARSPSRHPLHATVFQKKFPCLQMCSYSPTISLRSRQVHLAVCFTVDDTTRHIYRGKNTQNHPQKNKTKQRVGRVPDSTLKTTQFK